MRASQGIMGTVLTQLSIKNLTLVNHLELQFQGGMSAITGETGAGKSILLGALALALGDRADASLITEDAKQAEVSATFDLSEYPEANSWLEAKALSNEDSCILRRVISRDGRSRAFVNGSAMTLAELRELTEMLLDVHSQHEHQSLLKKDTHRRLLDEFGRLSDQANALETGYENFKQLTQKLNALKANAAETNARVQLLNYQADELDTLALEENELIELESERKRLDLADETHQRLIDILQLCAKDTEGSASSQSARALAMLDILDDERLQSIREMLESAIIQIDEAMADLSTSLGLFEADPERLHQIERRLATIYDIARKHKVNPEVLPRLSQSIKAELDQVRKVDEQMETFTRELENVERAYFDSAEELSVARSRSAITLQTAITEQLHLLGMQGACFEIDIRRASPGRHGIDEIEFLIATIPGGEVKSLGRIASGGELSRISLAIQVITAETSNTPSLVFDEVDVGVGGATAEVVGSLLRKLGENAQVICVTHLPQVAAQANQHYVVVKETSEETASTNVVQLTQEQKITEIARMLGGVEQTIESIAHAEAMVSSNKQ